MFRLFLRKKILKGDKGSLFGEDRQDSGHARKRNRRSATRYSIDHKHLTLMNDSDIFLVREISMNGFSTEVSQRSSLRLIIGDIYEAKIRYIGEIYNLEAKVAWKNETQVGFELVQPSAETLRFFKRLVRPVEIARSMALVDASFMQGQTQSKIWYHGDEESDLYVWRDPETKKLSAWNLCVSDVYIEWNEQLGLVSGSLSSGQASDSAPINKLKSPVQKADQTIDPKKRQLAIDILMALPNTNLGKELLATFLSVP